jgi:spermidine/putrescine transport system ATP-binding protein
MVRLEGLGRRRPTQLSGGQQQRVALARALVNRPSVLLLDEPLGALDLKLRRAMQLELRHLNRSVGITFIYVTHDQEEALTMSDRIAVMGGGHILQIGASQEIYEAPTTRFVADFIGETNFLAGTLLSWSEEQATVQTPGNNVLRARCRQPVPPGTAVTVAVRPERMHIEPADQPAGNDNCVLGRIIESVYAGATMQYTAQSSDGVLLGRTPNLGAVLSPGGEVLLRWAPKDCSVLTG